MRLPLVAVLTAVALTTGVNLALPAGQASAGEPLCGSVRGRVRAEQVSGPTWCVPNETGYPTAMRVCVSSYDADRLTYVEVCQETI